MMKNFNCCYKNLINQIKYVKFENIGYFRIHCIIQFMVHTSQFTREQILSKRQRKQFDIPAGATHVCLNIINLDEPDPVKSVIYHDCIKENHSVCYKVYNPVQHPVVVKSLC